MQHAAAWIRLFIGKIEEPDAHLPDAAEQDDTTNSASPNHRGAKVKNTSNRISLWVVAFLLGRVAGSVMGAAAASNDSTPRPNLSNAEMIKAISGYSRMVLDKQLDATHREIAAEDLGRLGPAALTTLTQFIHHPDGQVRDFGLKGLRSMGTPAGPTLAGLLGDSKVCNEAEEFLKIIHELPIQGLSRALESSDHVVVMRAARVIASANPAPPELLLPLLATAAKGRELWKKLDADPRKPLIIRDEHLWTAMSNRDGSCCLALAKYGPDGKAAAIWYGALAKSVKTGTAGAVLKPNASAPNRNGFTLSLSLTVLDTETMPSLSQFMAAWTQPKYAFSYVVVSSSDTMVAVEGGSVMADEGQTRQLNSSDKSQVRMMAEQLTTYSKMEDLDNPPAQAPQVPGAGRWYQSGWMFVISDADAHPKIILTDNAALREWIAAAQKAAKPAAAKKP